MKMKKSKFSQVIITPTDDRRHVSKIRYGKFSHEEFCKNDERRKELGLPPRYVEPQ
jgi:hypothetical protein